MRKEDEAEEDDVEEDSDDEDEDSDEDDEEVGGRTAKASGCLTLTDEQRKAFF